VSPGAVNTDFVAGRSLETLKKLAEGSPLRRVVEPDDVARTIMGCVLYLKTSTGVKVVCDGGRFLV
jgi:3-oxoacyl-[acyl-carrier protein] reductase